MGLTWLWCRAGEVVTFCWRLERSKTFTAQHEGEVLQYEIRAEVRDRP